MQMQSFFMQAGGEVNMMSQIVMWAAIFGFIWLLFIRPQKKRDKKTQEMRNAVEVGDEIVTIGGIIGLVVNIKEDWLVIETGNDRSKIRLARWAVQSNITDKSDPVEADPELK